MTCVSSEMGFGTCDCTVPMSGGAAGQGAAGTLAGAAGVTNGGSGTGVNVGTAGTTAGTAAAAGSGATAGTSGTLPDAGTDTTGGAYQRCDTGGAACPSGMMCVHPGQGVDQQSGPTLCTPACEPPSFGNPSPTNDCPAADSGSATPSCSLIESFCFLDCGTGECPDGMTCEALPVGPQTVMVCNYQ